MDVEQSDRPYRRGKKLEAAMVEANLGNRLMALGKDSKGELDIREKRGDERHWQILLNIYIYKYTIKIGSWNIRSTFEPGALRN